MCGEEFSPKLAGLYHPKAALFTTSKWFPVWVTVVYRLVFGCYCLGWIIFSGFHPSNGKTKWFIYFTNWSYCFVTMYFLVAVLASVHHFRRKIAEADNFAAVQMTEERESRDLEESAGNDADGDIAEQSPVAWYHKVQWLVYNIAAPNAFLISGVYWGVLYTGYPTDMLDISTHALNSVFMLTETCFGSVPVRVLHVIYPMTYASLYLVMTVVYWACGGTNALGKPYVYSILDYGSAPGLAAGMCLAYVLVAVPLCHMMLFGFHKIRSCITR